MTFLAASMMVKKVNAHYDEVSIEAEELCLDTISTDNIQKLSSTDDEFSLSNDEFILGLNDQYVAYSNLLNEATDDEKEEILKKMEKINETIELYGMINDGSESFRGVSVNCECDLEDDNFEEACAECIEYVATLTEVWEIAIGFFIRGWFLASDLLIHNIINEDLDSDYTPSNSLLKNLKESTAICEDIVWNDVLSGTYDAESPGDYNGFFEFENTEDGDVYNALGDFYYAKNCLGTNVVKISILDRYDWEYQTNGGLSAKLNNILFTAQELGIVTPFYTKIDIITEGYAPLVWGYNDDCVEIIGGNTNLVSYTIPTEWYDFRERQEGLPIINKVIIFDSAFSNHKNLVSITMPNTITYIGEKAFENCINLEEVNIGSSVELICDSAFENCSSLREIEIPNNVQYIGSSAFANCTSLVEVIVSSSVNYIGYDAFKNCSNLTIYPYSKTLPIGWHEGWNSSNARIIWGGKNRTLETETLTLSNYTFPSSYNDFNPISETINTQSGKSVITNRLRCGVIEYDNKSYLTLSAKNRNATQAYIEYYFHEYIVEIDYQLALWSSSESLINNSSIRLEILYNNEWIVVREFSAKELSQSKDELLDYNIEFQIPSKAIRFIVDTNQVYNDNNRGRLVIGDIDATMVHNYYYKVEEYDNEKHYLECDCGDSCHNLHIVTEKFEKNGYYYGFCDVCGDLIDLAHVIIPDIKTYSSFSVEKATYCDIGVIISKEESFLINE